MSIPQSVFHPPAPRQQKSKKKKQTPPSLPTTHIQSPSFPPGPPEHQFIYTLPGTSSAIIFYPLGFIPHRDERLVRRLLLDALDTSLEFRADAKLPVQRGYHLRIKNMVLAVAHVLGVFELTWGLCELRVAFLLLLPLFFSSLFCKLRIFGRFGFYLFFPFEGGKENWRDDVFPWEGKRSMSFVSSLLPAIGVDLLSKFSAPRAEIVFIFC